MKYMTQVYTSEIHRLLKLGDYSDSSHINGAPEGLPVRQAEVKLKNKPTVPEENFTNRLRGLIIYPIIFILAFSFFYVVLNFSSITAQVQGFFTKPQAQQELGNQLQPYYTWISNYYYAVSDSKLLDPSNDIDKDGLTNYDEFIMRTNPIVADSDGDGSSDGIEVINDYNPWGAGFMTAAQKELANKLDTGLINNRIGFNASQNSGIVLGTATTNFDLSKPGRLSIPKLNLSVDLIWSKDPSSFETDLTRGVIHYPGTALPGDTGTIYVSGHSSDYVWKHDPMQSIFAKINYLKPGDDVFIDVYNQDGKVYNYRYQVTGNAMYKPDDQTQFIDNSTSKLNLSTCWPIGTAANRLVVSAVQIAL